MADLINLQDNNKPAQVQVSGHYNMVLQPGDTIKIESDGEDWLTYEIPAASEVSVGIRITQI